MNNGVEKMTTDELAAGLHDDAHFVELMRRHSYLMVRYMLALGYPRDVAVQGMAKAFAEFVPDVKLDARSVLFRDAAIACNSLNEGIAV